MFVSLIDSHCHLDFPVFDGDRTELIDACVQQEIKQFIVPGISCATWPRLIELAKTYPECHPAYGLHPYFIDEHQISHVAELEKVLRANPSIAIGEIGLDYYSKKIDKEKQKKIFHAQLALASEMGLPVILHVRKAHDDVIYALRKYKTKGGAVHAFNGSFQQAQCYIELGFKLGFGGALVSEQARHLRKLAQDLPLGAIVLETDSPDMQPINYHSSRNTPLTILAVRDTLVSLRNESGIHITTQTTSNVLSVFELMRSDIDQVSSKKSVNNLAK